MKTIDDITTLIPQRAPMLMVDSYTYHDDMHGMSMLRVAEDNLFLLDGILQREAVLEHVAQTAAAHAGYRRIVAGLPVCLGFIGDIKKVSFGTDAKVGDVLDTDLRVISEVGNIIMIEATVSVGNNDNLVCQCRMKLAMDA